jgi:hypothetical protein
LPIFYIESSPLFASESIWDSDSELNPVHHGAKISSIGQIWTPSFAFDLPLEQEYNVSSLLLAIQFPSF